MASRILWTLDDFCMTYAEPKPPSFSFEEHHMSGLTASTTAEVKARARLHNACRLAYLEGVRDTHAAVWPGHVVMYDPASLSVRDTTAANRGFISAGDAAKARWPHVTTTEPRIIRDPDVVDLQPGDVVRWYRNVDGVIHVAYAPDEALARSSMWRNARTHGSGFSPTLKRLSVWASLLERPKHEVELK